MDGKTPKYISTQDASKLFEDAGFGVIDLQTVRNWIVKHKFGLKIGGQWKIDEMKFKLFLEGKYEEGKEKKDKTFQSS